jgi:amino acid transporter
MIGGRQPLRGNKPGDRRVRVDRPEARYFRYTDKNVLTAKAAASAPTTATGRAWERVRRVLIGRPLASEEEAGERLSKAKALAIFSSDAISSSAYATEEILRALLFGTVGVSLAALAWSVPVAVAVAILLAVVAISYRQVCMAYPTGGGSYSVSKANFGRMASLVAASALLIDYVLTVAVSISSASEQVVAALPGLHDIQVEIAVAAIVLVTLGNLRGLRESGNVFAAPTYLFVGMALLMIVMGTFQIVVQGQGGPAPSTIRASEELTTVALLVLLLRAFASGAVALTGVEAIATGVPAFRPPESRNAATTLGVMAVLLAVLFVGITFLASGFGVVPDDQRTVIAQVAGHVFGTDSIGYLLFLTFATLILVLAANTSFAAFPRLTAILARDGYFPRHFGLRGDRLAFTTGILVLGGVATILVVAFEGDTHSLIPLYAVGVFIDFTISQSGMVRHWLRTRPPGYRRRLAINTFGAIITGTVAVIVTLMKLPGSLVVVVLIPLLVALMLGIARQYEGMTRQLEVRSDLVFGQPRKRERVVIPVPSLSRAVVQAIQVGRALSDDVQVVHVTEDLDEGEALRRTFERQFPGVPFVIVESPYRALVQPFVTWLDVAHREPDTMTIVVIPEYVARHWWERVLYNQTARRLRSALLGRPATVVTAVPYRREDAHISARTTDETAAPGAPTTGQS